MSPIHAVPLDSAYSRGLFLVACLDYDCRWVQVDRGIPAVLRTSDFGDWTSTWKHGTGWERKHPSRVMVVTHNAACSTSRVFVLEESQWMSAVGVLGGHRVEHASELVVTMGSPPHSSLAGSFSCDSASAVPAVLMRSMMLPLPCRTRPRMHLQSRRPNQSHQRPALWEVMMGGWEEV